jgi:hypothetical protein
MALYYLSIEPTIVKDLQNRYKYIVMANNYVRSKPNKGKRYTNEENKEYNQIIEKMKKSDDAFKSGEVDLHNNQIELIDFIKNLSSAYLTNFDRYDFYRIEPIESKRTYEQYSYNRDKYWTNKFKVVKKMNTLEELISQLHKDGLLDEFVGKYFESFCYVNEGYKEKNIAFFELLKSKFKDYKPCLSHILVADINHYEVRARFSTPYESIFELINYYLDNDLINLRHEWDNDDIEVFTMLLKYKWFELAYKYLMEIETDSYDFGQMKKDDVINTIIRSNSGDKFVKQIITHLGIEDTFVTLKVKTYEEDDYDDKLIESKTFKDIDELKTYLIKEYDVPFSEINKDIDRIRGNDEYIRFYIE